MNSLGYAVIEWNQASGQPSLADQDIYPTAREAEDRAQWFRDALARSGSGRRERWTVAEVEQVEEDN